MLEDIRSIDELALDRQRVFIRLDLDVPCKNGAVQDDRRLRAALPVIRRAQEAGARLVLGATLGDPQGAHRSALSLEPVGARLSELLDAEIYLPDDSVGDAARKVVQDLRPGQICLLENLAFHPEEAANDEAFARKLADLTDVYVNDAPRALNRRAASTCALPRLIRRRAMGPLLAAELAGLERLRAAQRPFVAVVGGAGVARKLDFLESLLGRLDAICAGGVLGNTLLTAQGRKLGASRIESDVLARARAFLTRAKDHRVNVVLPSDAVVADDERAASGDVFTIGLVPQDGQALDVGPATVEAFRQVLDKAKTILCYGALGAAEHPAFRAGTRAVVQAIAAMPAFHALCGTGVADALVGEEEAISKLAFVSAGGDASLELLSGRRSPALEALRGGET